MVNQTEILFSNIPFSSWGGGRTDSDIVSKLSRPYSVAIKTKTTNKEVRYET